MKNRNLMLVYNPLLSAILIELMLRTIRLIDIGIKVYEGLVVVPVWMDIEYIFC